MVDRQPAVHHVQATVEEVLPATGLAFVTDTEDRCWGITRSTPGAGLASLRPGQHVDLTVVDHNDFQLVSDYAPFD